MEYKVKLSSIRSVVVTVELEDGADPIDVEDAAADLYYRGDVTFPEGSPSLEPTVISGLRPEHAFIARLQAAAEVLAELGLDHTSVDAEILKADRVIRAFRDAQ